MILKKIYVCVATLTAPCQSRSALLSSAVWGSFHRQNLCVLWL